MSIYSFVNNKMRLAVSIKHWCRKRKDKHFNFFIWFQNIPGSIPSIILIFQFNIIYLKLYHIITLVCVSLKENYGFKLLISYLDT